MAAFFRLLFDSSVDIEKSLSKEVELTVLQSLVKNTAGNVGKLAEDGIGIADMLSVENNVVRFGETRLSTILDSIKEGKDVNELGKILTIENLSSRPSVLVSKSLASLVHQTVPDAIEHAENIAIVESERELQSIIKRETFEALSAHTSKEIESAADVQKVFETLAKTDSSFHKFISNLGLTLKASKYAVIVAGSTFGIEQIAEWIANFIQSNSGPRFITRIGKLLKNERIKDPYPCGFKNKSGTVTHPLDDKIQNYMKNESSVCSDWQQFDKCGGWTNLSAFGRISVVSKNEFPNIVHNFPSNAKMRCDDVTIAKALVALTRNIGIGAGEVVRNTAEGILQGLGIHVSIKLIAFITVSVFSTFFVIKQFTHEASNVNEKTMRVFTLVFLFVFLLLLYKILFY